MLQHRHVWNEGTFSNWHEASRKHTKADYAADLAFETRDFTPGTRAAKVAVAEPVAAVSGYDTPLTLAAEETVAAVKEAVAVVAKASKASKNLPRALKV